MADQCANPILAGFLQEWMNEARERSSKGYTVYKKAYHSMTSCPTKFHHPSEAQVLVGLGPKLCDRLVAKLRQYCESEGLEMPKRRDEIRADDSLQALRVREGSAGIAQGSPTQKSRLRKAYVPKLRSGAYALIMALATLDQESGQAIPKSDLIALAQPLCDSSFTAPSEPGKFFTAWNSMKTLEGKELVCTRGHPTKRYYLSDEGWEVALRMKATESRPIAAPPTSEKRKASTHLPSPTKRRSLSPTRTREKQTGSRPLAPRTTNLQPVASDIRLQIKPSSMSRVVSLLSSPGPEASLSSAAPSMERQNAALNSRTVVSSQTKSLSVQPALGASMVGLEDTIVLPAGSFETRMVLDMREIRTTTDRDYISTELKKLNVDPIIKSLPLGDVLWIAKVKPEYADTLREGWISDDPDLNLEVVLEHILERKRLDDLLASIKDGRFHEQKFRLHKSGIKNITYLIEECTVSAERSEKYGPAMESAIASMQVVNGFFVKRTQKLDETIRYLARMTKTLEELYQNANIRVVPARSFDTEAFSLTLGRLRNLSPSTKFGITFPAFAATCDKSDSMALKDVYLKMLMCTRGVTGDKAIEIQKLWNTPRALVEAYDQHNGNQAKENMISNRLGQAIPRKKVGKALSAKLATIWTDSTRD